MNAVAPVYAAHVPDPRDEVRRGFVWLGSASAIARVLEIAKVGVVLLCLSQQELGEATLAWSVSVVLEALNGLGLGQALLQCDRLDERTVASAFWYTMGVATLLVIGVCLAAYPLADAYDLPSLAPMVMVSSTKLWFVGAALVPLTLLNRALGFERLAVVSTLATLCSGLTTCGLALAGVGAWAPVLGHTLGGVATMVFAMIAQPYRPRLRFHWHALRHHASFGLKLSGSSLVSQMYRNVDYLLVGHWLDVAAVGVYRVAFDLAMTPCLAVGQVINRSAVPVYAQLRHDRPRLASTFLWTLESLGLAVAPLTAVIALEAAPLLALVKGGVWSEAAGVVPWLSAAALLRCVDQTFPQLFQALHKPWLSLYDSVLSSFVVTGFIAAALGLFGRSHGAVAAAWGWTAAYPLLIAVVTVLTMRLLPITFRQVVHSQRHTLGCVLAMTVAHTLATAILGPSKPQVALGVGIMVSIVSYVAYLRLVARIHVGRIFRGR